MQNINAKFDAIIAAEAEIKNNAVLAECGIDATTRARGKKHWTEARNTVSVALAAMDFNTFSEFAAYRLARADELGGFPEL